MTGRPMLSAREIAAAIGVNKRAVQLRADRGEWAHVIQAHTNGRPIKLYEVARLPAEIREEIARRSLATVEAPKPIVPAAPIDTTPAADWQRRCADARAALLAELDRLAETHGVNRAVEAMVSAAADGTLAPVLAELVPAANARAGSDGGRTLSPRTLKRWRAARAAGGWAGLLPQATAADPDEPAWAAEFMKLYRRPSKPTIAMCLREMAKSRPTGIDMPSYDQVRRYLAKVAPVVKEAGRMGPMALLALQGHKRRTTEGLQPMDVITMDGHTLKGLVEHPIHRRHFGPELCAAEDVATRYVVGWSAGLAESTWVVIDALRHAVERFGVPAILHTDNGAGFVNEVMSGDGRALGVLARLGITHERSQPGRAQSRGKIERLQRTLWKTSARSLVTYRGRDMDREIKKRIDQRIERDTRERGASRHVMSWEEFLAWAAAQVEDYNNRPHRALRRIKDPLTGKMRHMSPAEAMAERQAEGWEPALLPAPVAADLTRPYQEVPTRRGEVKLPWGRYYAPALDAYHGQTVRVGYDIHDGEQVWVRDQSDRLIAIAIRDANVIPEQPASKLELAIRKRTETRLKRIAMHREEAAAELASPVLEGRAQPAAPAGDLPRITSIPTARPAAATALPPVRPKRPAAMPPIVEKLRSEGVIDLRPTGAARDVTERAERIGRAIDIEDRMAAGQAVDDADLTWLEGYRRTAEYRSGVSFERERRAFMGAAAAQ
ncbi:DDE-type integrase/transposase/recombinase (plasmid) [Tistrella mobilis]|uniref:Mu transposase C-terminal domain-containing protein n=1 Tax=Tistrella mobilis TaxID=171437 RepID=UPI003558EBF8